MDIFTTTPSWDFLLAASILIVSVYGFIVGESKTVKALLCIYPAFFVADTLSMILPNLFPNMGIAIIRDNAIAGSAILSGQVFSFQMLALIKVIIFFVFWIALIRLSFFHVEAKENGKKIGNIFLFSIISLSFALLFINVLLLLYSGWSIVGFDAPRHVLSDLATDSFLSMQFVRYHGIFFAIPAVVLVLSAFLHHSDGGDDEE